MVTHLSDKLLALRVYFGAAAVSFTFFRIFTRTWTPALLEDLSASTLSILVNFFKRSRILKVTQLRKVFNKILKLGRTNWLKRPLYKYIP